MKYTSLLSYLKVQDDGEKYKLIFYPRTAICMVDNFSCSITLFALLHFLIATQTKEYSE